MQFLKDIIPRAVDEVGGPTIMATLTVIAALLPMAFCFRFDGAVYEPNSNQLKSGYGAVTCDNFYSYSMAGT